MSTNTLPRTPAPHGERNWRETGTHATERETYWSVCDCGPANHLTGPQFAVVNGIEYRQATIIPL